ncbi:hypothetical protein RFN29_28695 [Mesorhizobium sp. VK22B]|uniref:AAA domain-containing protein n=1 Tax=Mesorhizobium captivum TaxID=3072319 RepID=A0ABU4Z8F9_9HYPH|nr:hypothetical protein [Mesorhizobium sp. VK22B]MDX8495539.1 hypothetical protein [Mesorhizobium sp. VK22B]
MIVTSLGKRHDVVIIDAPPIVGLSDAPILSRLAEGALMVVSTNQVTRKSAKTALTRPVQLARTWSGPPCRSTTASDRREAGLAR